MHTAKAARRLKHLQEAYIHVRYKFDYSIEEKDLRCLKNQVEQLQARAVLVYAEKTGQE